MQGVSSVEGTLFLPCEIGSEGYYMKRSLALVLLSTVMVLALSFGLAACGDKPAENLEYEEFETVVNAFRFYNCNGEMGRYPAFYVKGV